MPTRHKVSYDHHPKRLVTFENLVKNINSEQIKRDLPKFVLLFLRQHQKY